jgi:hypothetical protein
VAGDVRFTQDDPAGFWYGLWHGVISVITLIIHVFNENVAVYEINNSGGWYDFGFILGVITIWGGGSHIEYNSSKERRREKERKEIEEKLEKKVMQKLKEWADEGEPIVSAEEWGKVGRNCEEMVKRRIREWVESD